jgi:hypothetical protein
MPPLCEEVRLAAMALADRAEARLSPAEVDAHLRQCPACRAEVAALRALVSLLARQSRQVPAEDLWPGIRAALDKGSADRAAWRSGGVLVLLGSLLVAVRLSLLAPAAVPWLAANAAAVLVALVAFLLLRENPLHISESLHLPQGEDA